MGTARPISGTVDIGASEFNPAAPMGPYGNIFLKNTVSSSSLRRCTFEFGAGVLNLSANAAFVHCDFKNNTGWGYNNDLTSVPIGGGDIPSSTATSNYSGGIRAVNQDLTGCLANYNFYEGMEGGALANCSAIGNVGIGLVGSVSVTDCIA